MGFTHSDAEHLYPSWWCSAPQSTSVEDNICPTSDISLSRRKVVAQLLCHPMELGGLGQTATHQASW